MYVYCRQEANRLRADILMSLEHIFAYMSPKTTRWTWKKLGRGMGMEKEWSCKINFLQDHSRSPEKASKFWPFFVANITYRLGHFRFNHFCETLQEYVNWYPRESFRREILIFFPLRRQFSPKIDFSVASMNFGVNNINKKPSCC